MSTNLLQAAVALIALGDLLWLLMTRACTFCEHGAKLAMLWLTFSTSESSCIWCATRRKKGLSWGLLLLSSAAASGHLGALVPPAGWGFMVEGGSKGGAMENPPGVSGGDVSCLGCCS